MCVCWLCACDIWHRRFSFVFFLFSLFVAVHIFRLTEPSVRPWCKWHTVNDEQFQHIIYLCIARTIWHWISVQLNNYKIIIFSPDDSDDLYILHLLERTKPEMFCILHTTTKCLFRGHSSLMVVGLMSGVYSYQTSFKSLHHFVYFLNLQMQVHGWWFSNQNVTYTIWMVCVSWYLGE